MGLNQKIIEYIKKEMENERAILNIIINHNNQDNLNNRPNQDIDLRLNNANRRLIALGALIDFFVELIARNPNNISRCSTNIEQNDNNNDNFDIQKTRNIIVENKNEYSIDIDIKNFSLNKDEKLTASKSIDLEQIQIDYIPNSEEKKINNNKENENNNNNI